MFYSLGWQTSNRSGQHSQYIVHSSCKIQLKSTGTSFCTYTTGQEFLPFTNQSYFMSKEFNREFQEIDPLSNYFECESLQSWGSESDRMKEKLLVLIGRIGKEARVGKIPTKVDTLLFSIYFGYFGVSLSSSHP